MHRRTTRVSALLAAIAMIGGVLALSVGTAAAGTPAVTVTPNSNLLNGQVVSVAITADVTNTHFYAVTQCGNADSSGNPVTPGDAGNCVGQADGVIGQTLNLVSDAGTGLAAAAGGLTAGTVYTVPLTLEKTNMGANHAQCLPVGGAITTPCTIAVAEADASQNTYGQTVVPITYRPPATVTITSVTGQTGTQAARAGDVISISGINWDPSQTGLTASLCDTTLTTCDATGVTGTVGTDASGNLTSTGLTVDATATSGARALKVTDGTQTASTPVQILGSRTITVSPSAGGSGTVVTVNGSGFDASSTIAISATDGTVGVGTPTITAASATGAVTGTVTITDPTTVAVTATELDGSNQPIAGTTAIAPFTYSGNSCDVPNGGQCTVVQTVTLDVTPGTLNITQADNQVTMGAVALNGAEQTSTGQIQHVTITDARGSLPGWDVSATMTDLTLAGGGTNSSIPAGNMSVVSPSCAPSTATSGSSTGITVGATAQTFASQVALCNAAVGEGGGTYGIDSGLSLTVPATIRAGTYSSTLTILLV